MGWGTRLNLWCLRLALCAALATCFIACGVWRMSVGVFLAGVAVCVTLKKWCCSHRRSRKSPAQLLDLHGMPAHLSLQQGNCYVVGKQSWQTKYGSGLVAQQMGLRQVVSASSWHHLQGFAGPRAHQTMQWLASAEPLIITRPKVRFRNNPHCCHNL